MTSSCKPDAAAGFTLIEVLIAMGLLAFLFAGALPAFMVCLGANGRNENRSEAVAAAQQTMENLRRVAATLPSTGNTGPVNMTVGDHTYSVLTRHCVDTALCPAGTHHVIVEVSQAGRLVYGLESVFTELD